MNKTIWTVAALALVLTACKSTPMNPAKVEDSSVTRPMTNSQGKSGADSSASTDKINIKTVDVDTSKDELSAAELAKRHWF